MKREKAALAFCTTGISFTYWSIATIVPQSPFFEELEVLMSSDLTSYEGVERNTHPPVCIRILRGPCPGSIVKTTSWLVFSIVLMYRPEPSALRRLLKFFSVHVAPRSFVAVKTPSRTAIVWRTLSPARPQ